MTFTVCIIYCIGTLTLKMEIWGNFNKKSIKQKVEISIMYPIILHISQLFCVKVVIPALLNNKS